MPIKITQVSMQSYPLYMAATFKDYDMLGLPYHQKQ